MAIHLIVALIFGGVLILTSATNTFAIGEPIPGIDIVVRKNPGGQRIRVGDCRAAGGKIVKLGNQWVCNVAKPKAR
jgi:hypothetical protein